MHAMNDAPRVLFDVMHLYYLPQYAPVAAALARRGARCELVFHTGHDSMEALHAAAAREGLPHRFVADEREAAELYAREAPDWLVLGNNFGHLDRLARATRTATLYHGIGVKDCYYDAPLMQTTLRFCEGDYRLAELERRFPRGPARVHAVGFAKLDPLFAAGEDRAAARARFGLDPARRTVLYAPTYYPSSIECLPRDWPREIAECNLLVKPHQFSYSKSRYRGHWRVLDAWREFPHVKVAAEDDYSLLPFMRAADVLVSEASSAMFEFAALDRPIVWCDFVKLRWQHRGPLRFRFEARMDRGIERYADIGAHAATPAALAATIRAELATPGRHAARRRQYTAELIGPTDGRTGERIAAVMLDGAT